jgi:hypothetical protein
MLDSKFTVSWAKAGTDSSTSRIEIAISFFIIPP